MIVSRVGYILKIFPKLSETFIACELAELRRRGIELRIFSLLPPRDELRHDIIRSAGLQEVTSYDAADFGRILREFQPQLLHAHFATESTALAQQLAREHAIPFTFTSHGYDIYRKPPADFAARAAAAGAVITVSEANAAYIAQTFGVNRSHIRVIPCGVDTTRFYPNGAVPHTGPPVILAVARLVAVKNLSLLLKGCALLRNQDLNFRCVIVGEGEGACRADLERLRSELGLQDLVEMPGVADQDTVRKLWQTATVGVLTSTSEGMPVSLMEAAACGVPVVATAVGGVPELVLDGVTGLLAPSGNPEVLARALQWVLLDPDLRTRMSLAARRRAEQHFSVARQVDQLTAVWSDILREDAR